MSHSICIWVGPNDLYFHWDLENREKPKRKSNEIIQRKIKSGGLNFNCYLTEEISGWANVRLINDAIENGQKSFDRKRSRTFQLSLNLKVKATQDLKISGMHNADMSTCFLEFLLDLSFCRLVFP